MRLDDLDPQGDIQDQGRRRGGFGGLRGGGGGGGLLGLLFSFLPMLLGRRKMGCGTILLIGAGVLAFMYFSGGGLQLADGTGSQGTSIGSTGQNVACDTQEEMHACRVFTSNEQTWERLFRENGSQYQAAKLRFYDRNGESGCGAAQSAMGPFYCPADRGIYLDTTFFNQMSQRMGAAGDFAQAYVIAHEVGHHIQNLSGVADQVRSAQRRASKAEGNALQVRMELQADCYAGVWAAQNASRMEPGDVEEGLRAAHAIGDDTIMRNAGQRPVESMFTHGTSQQRMAWLKRGMEAGSPNACDTFARGAVR